MNKKLVRIGSGVAAGVSLLSLAACGGEQAPLPESDSGHNFSDKSARVPVDETVYHLRGKVIGDVKSHETTEGGGSVSGSTYNGMGSMYGSYWLQESGKGFVRLSIEEMNPANLKLGDVGDVVIIKTTDQKAIALHEGDVIDWTCRSDYEPVGAVLENEKFDKSDIERMGTYEIDLCRMASPRVGEDPGTK
jgi:hypothetical protein